MASPAELSLDCKPHSYSLLLKSVGEQQQQPQQQQQQQTDQTQKLEEFLARLEEERLKIEAFKRELPLCMQLLNNAMEASRQQLHSYIAANQGPKPVLEQFIPLQTPNTEGSDKMMMMNHHTSDKANWMVSAQLWSQESGENPQLQSSKETESIIGLKGKQITNVIGGGHIIPYGNHQGSSEGLPELTLASSEKECEEKRNLESICRAKNVLEQGKAGNGHADSNNTPTANRKARRCWSPDLHRRFVNALHMLGGSQVATPKQIRELMKVDGLTNDEVKSHLQKYRLHTRRPSPSPQGGAAAGTPQLVVLGGIWVPQEYAAAAAAAAHGGATAAALYSPHHLTTNTTHAASPHYCAGPLPQDFYHGPTPPALPPHHHHHHQLHHHDNNQLIHAYRQKQQQQPGTQQSQAQSSPESDFRGGCNGGGLSESIEDGKSESGSDGENGRGGMKALMIREEREESNGSEITLKF